MGSLQVHPNTKDLFSNFCETLLMLFFILQVWRRTKAVAYPEVLACKSESNLQHVFCSISICDALVSLLSLL